VWVIALFADSDEVSGLEEGSGGGCLAATGLREAHPETIESTEPTKITKSADLNERTSKNLQVVGNSCELDCWPNLCRGVAAFTGGLQMGFAVQAR
jgi:hypothetical protein